MRPSMRASRSKRRARRSPSASFPIACSRLAFEDRTRLNFALELDRGTMDIKSTAARRQIELPPKIARLLPALERRPAYEPVGLQGLPRPHRDAVGEAHREHDRGAEGDRGRAGLQSLSLHDAKAPRREVAACRCVGHRQGRPDGSPIMTALVATNAQQICAAGSSFGWPDFGAGPALSRARFALPAAASRSASLDSASCARATFTAMQMRSSARFDKV